MSEPRGVHGGAATDASAVDAIGFLGLGTINFAGILDDSCHEAFSGQSSFLSFVVFLFMLSCVGSLEQRCPPQKDHRVSSKRRKGSFACEKIPDREDRKDKSGDIRLL